MSQNHPLSSTENTAQDWFLRLALGEISDADLRAFKAWRDSDPSHRAAFEEIRDLWNDLEDLKPAFAVSSDMAEEDIAEAAPKRQAPSEVIRLDQRRGSPRAGRRFAVGSLVAACLLFVGIFSWDLQTGILADFRTHAGEQASITLPDGSTAHLNTDSAIALDFTEDSREVALLRGEALFEVEKDPHRPFSVTAVEGASTAVGTTYSVRDIGEGAVVTVLEGRVRVVSPAGGATFDQAKAKHVELAANQQVGYRRGTSPGHITSVQAADATAWRRGLLLIDALPFADAVSEIDRYQAGRILVLADSKQIEPVTARIALAEIDDGLRALAALHGLKVTQIADYLTILH